MKKFFLLLFLGLNLNSTKLYSQNLVPNPSFEEYYQCPFQLSTFVDDEVAKCVTHWWSFGNTPDYFNSCTNYLYVGVPSNLFGYQEAKTGNAYCGLHTYYANDKHEFIGCKLTNPLTKDSVYYVEFSVSSGWGTGTSDPVMFTNNIGARFSMDSFSNSHPVAISNFAHVNSSAVVMDTVNWVAISGYFTADSNYRYISFGNFYTNDNTDTVYFASHQGSTDNSYYYFDDVCVAKHLGDCLGSYNGVTRSPNNTKPNISPNPTSTTIHLHLSSTQPTTLSIFNVLGEKLREEKISGNEISIDVSELPAGMYVVRTEKELIGKFVKE